MNSKRGKWSQYEILKADEKIKPYLVHTELFTEESFYQNLRKRLVVRPCYSPAEISVSLFEEKEGTYKIQTGTFSAAFTGKKDAFQYVSQACAKEKFHILQDLSFSIHKNEKPVELFVTLHRDSFSVWRVAEVMGKNNLLSQKEITAFQETFQKAAVHTVLCLEKHYPACSTFVLEIGCSQEKWWIQDVNLDFSKSKWNHHQALSSIKELSPYLPPTQLATAHTIFHFLKTYKQVMLKPCLGQWGKGIIQVSTIKEDVFEVHNKRKKFVVEGQTAFINYLYTNYLSKERYIVQKTIQLATINNCVFDLRIMVQRKNAACAWEVTGRAAKVSVRDFIVTNVAKSIIPLEEALKKSFLQTNATKLASEIDHICLIAARHLGDYYPVISRIGLDIGLDKDGRSWLIEANLVPDVSLFKQLQDQSIYEKIINKSKNDQTD